MSRLVDYSALPEALRDLGFGAVTFSYPLRTLPSSYLACAESPLVDFTPEELHASFEAVKALGKQFPVLNPVASICAASQRDSGASRAGVLLFGLASAALAVPQLGPAALRHPRVRRNAARARRLHQLYDRLLSRRFGHAACRCSSKRRHARSCARGCPAGLEPLGRSAELGLRGGSSRTATAWLCVSQSKPRPS